MTNFIVLLCWCSCQLLQRTQGLWIPPRVSPSDPSSPALPVFWQSLGLGVCAQCIGASLCVMSLFSSALNVASCITLLSILSSSILIVLFAFIWKAELQRVERQGCFICWFTSLLAASGLLHGYRKESKNVGHGMLLSHQQRAGPGTSGGGIACTPPHWPLQSLSAFHSLEVLSRTFIQHVR